MKQSTVRTIRQAGTWPEFQRRKAARLERLKARKSLDTAVKGKVARPELVTENWSSELLNAYTDFQRDKKIMLKRIEEAHSLAKDAHKKLNPLLVEHNKQIVFDALSVGKSWVDRLLAPWRTR